MVRAKAFYIRRKQKGFPYLLVCIHAAFFILAFLGGFSQDTLSWQDQVDQIQLRAKSLSNQGNFDSAVAVLTSPFH